METATSKSTSHVNREPGQQQADAFTAEASSKLPPTAPSQPEPPDSKRHIPIELVERFLHSLVVA
jgi:hypothetical protein